LIFQIFLFRYGHRWRSLVEGQEHAMAREWARGLAGLEKADIESGLERWQGDWPPALPEFRKICEGADAPPSADEAWNIVCNARGAAGSLMQRYKHAAVLAAATDKRISVRIFNMMQLPASSAIRAWKQVYDEHVAAWRVAGIAWPEGADEEAAALGNCDISARSARKQNAKTAQREIARIRDSLKCDAGVKDPTTPAS
jgi:hypothetical protein